MNEQATAGGWVSRLRDWFPDREFFMRSEGQVRFITISSRVQMAAAGIVLAAVVAVSVIMGAMAWSQYRASADRALLVKREARVATSEDRIADYRDDIGQVAEDLKRRQTFLEDMVASLPSDVKDTAASDATAEEAQATAAKVSMAVPEAAALAKLEARQLAFVHRLTLYAQHRSKRAAEGLRKLGLDPRAMLQSAERQAMGGPLETLGTGRDSAIDPRFETLGLTLARMNALERGLAGVPQVLPVKLGAITSGFGYRRDPFTGHGAMHSGIDFEGDIGTPIRAAAKGRVTFVGRMGGYGNAVEITHGNGLKTRYAHMSRFAVNRGDLVEAGDRIGAVGSTGRSTGPHLHFEVRIRNRAVNPRPFLEKAPDVLEEIHRRSELALNQ